MIKLVTYSDETMSISRTRCIKSALNHGIDTIDEWDRFMIEQTHFYKKNRSILDQPRGNGYWLWKPFIIYHSLLTLKEGDILIYADAGVEFINDVAHIIDVMDQDVFLFGNNYNHVDWCKGDVIDKILGKFDIEAKQVQASVICFRVSNESMEFVKEWLTYCQMPGLIDDSPSKTANYPTFAEHRHDQAILTCLQIKHGYKLHWWPAIYKDAGGFIYDKIDQYKEDKYPVIFNHHRKRNTEYEH